MDVPDVPEEAYYQIQAEYPAAGRLRGVVPQGQADHPAATGRLRGVAPQGQADHPAATGRLRGVVPKGKQTILQQQVDCERWSPKDKQTILNSVKKWLLQITKRQVDREVKKYNPVVGTQFTVFIKERSTDLRFNAVTANWFNSANDFYKKYLFHT